MYGLTQYVLGRTGLPLELEGRSGPVCSLLGLTCSPVNVAQVDAPNRNTLLWQAESICPRGTSLDEQTVWHPIPVFLWPDTSLEEMLAACNLPCSPTAALSRRLCCSMQVPCFGFDPLKILLCKTSLGVHFRLCALSKSEWCSCFLYCQCISYIFHSTSKSKSAQQLVKKCFTLLSCILTNAKGTVPVPVRAVLASALDPAFMVISDPCTHHMHQELFLNHRIKLLSSTTWSNQCDWTILPG